MTAAPSLSRREREVMDIIYGLGQASATDVQEQMTDAPTNAAVRSTLRILVEKGHLEIEQQGPRYLYAPTAGAQGARRSAIEHLLKTFFGGSVEGAMAALLDMEDANLAPEDRARIRSMIERAEREGR